MKTVFIATDFSPASRNASLYGVHLATFLGARIVLFYASEYFPPPPGESPYDSIEEAKSIIESKLLNEVMAIRITEFQPVDILTEMGIPKDIILECASRYQETIIVCGMKGEGKKIKRLMGTTAVHLARNSKIPVMIIPEEADYVPVRSIVLANDFSVLTDIHTIDLIQAIGERYQSKVYIVRVMPNHTNEVSELSFRSERFVQKLHHLHPEYKFLRSKRITECLENFIRDYNIDLLAVIPHRHNILERLFSASMTKKFIFHTHIPLLVLPEIKIHLQ
ncbi:MAG: universal stress protein [Ferruginibacter sp.]|nr:universal stress protein [Ferruginibacter sp.]